MKRHLILGLCICLAPLALAGCGDERRDGLSGKIEVDGSSTVYLITKAMATGFTTQHPDVRINIGISGTGGGFKKFAAGEIDLADASRAIEPDEAAACRANGIDYQELQIGWDGLAVIIHKQNTWARELTVEQLRHIWRPRNPAKKWSDVNPDWPDAEIALYGPGAESGTFDHFTEAVNGRERSSRTDYSSSEDDNNLVNGVAANKYALGYLGLAYYEAHRDRLAVAAISAGPGEPFVTPSVETVLTKTYRPLSRPLFVYVRRSALARPEVRAFLRFYLRRDDLVTQARYVALNARGQYEQQEKLEEALRTLK
jgi:phosphate transport system substrate-binding protein